MRYLFIVVCAVFVSGVSAQENTIVIEGKVIDKVSFSPIAFASVSLTSDKSFGTITDESGQFQLKVNAISKSDSILISCIGYETSRYQLGDINGLMVIELIAKSYVLAETIITPDTAVVIVKAALEKLESNLGGKNILQGFYREIVRSTKTYDRLVEAAVDVFDNGYDGSGHNNKLQFKIRELRKSEDYMDLDWKAAIFNYLSPKNRLHSDNPESLFYNDYIRNHDVPFRPLRNAPLNEDVLNDFTFSIDSLLDYGRYKLVRILILDPLPERGISGKIFIRDTDLAIFQMELSRMEESNISLRVPGENILHSTLIKYQEYEGAMYLKMLYRKSFRTQINHSKFNKSKGRDGSFYDEMIFVTNEIITEKSKLKKFRKKVQQKRNIDLYAEDWVYNQAFWESYNVVKDLPLSPAVVKDLERDMNLNDQFLKNGAQ